MFNTRFFIDNDGYIRVETDYDGELAVYLRNNNNFTEKGTYHRSKEYTLSSKPQTGLVSLLFFFKDVDNNIKTYESKQYFYDSKSRKLKIIKTEELAESKWYKISYFNQESDITFITFNGTKGTKKTKPFGLDFIIKRGWNLISVAQEKDSQYQGLSIQEFYNAVNKVLVNKKVYSYGSSLGGYCALYYGGCVNATIISASPMNSAHPSFKTPKFEALSFEHDSLEKIPLTNKQVYIVYDPTIERDVRFIRDYVKQGYKNIEGLEIENGTHAVLETLLAADVLKIYIYSILKNNYNSELHQYILAKCKFYQKSYDQAFSLLDSLFKIKIESEFNTG